MLVIRRRVAASVLLVLSITTPAFASFPERRSIDAGPLVAHRAAAITGKVTDSETSAPIPNAQVTVNGLTRIGTTTDANGDFTIRGLAAGAYTLRATRLGYAPREVSVDVPSDGNVTVNIAMAHAVARLEEIVTTATGDVSRREVGNVIATVNADSIVSAAPITNVGELLQGRTAGVQVLQTYGVIGGSPNIRIRGIGSLSGSNEPLVVIDGARFSNENEPGNVSGIRQNRLSTIDPEEIESLDVIKGPSAAALYGTAAANGVIIIKTKHGRAGSTKWRVFAEGGASAIPDNYPANYWSFGRNITNGVTGTAAIHCTLAASAQGQCVIDSTTSFNPWKDPRTDPFQNGPTSRYGAQANGGNDQIRFFVSADRDVETGPYKMPAFEQNRLITERGFTPSGTQIRPNQLHQTSLRGNFTFSLAKNATLDVTSGYQDRENLTPFDGTFFQGLSNQLFSAPGFVTASNGTAGQFVGDIFSVGQREQLERFFGSVTANYTPRAWLQLTAGGGIDNANSNNAQFQFPGQGPTTSAWGPTAAQGFSGVDITRANSLQYTANAQAQATRQLSGSLTSVSTIGGQWFKSGTYQLFGEGYGLGVGATTPTAAAQRLATTTTTENATYGAYLQEQLNWRDRLYGTAAARVDKNSAFGRDNGTTVYPSVNLSYLVSEEPWFPSLRGLSRLRLRSSLGEAGVPPGTTAALQFLSPLTYPAQSGDVPGLTVQSVGNLNLKPEVTREFEIGFDAGLVRDRVNVEFTVYNKDSHDQIFNRPLPPSFGVGGTQTVNIARVLNRGQELAVDASILDNHYLSWSTRLNGSHNTNRLVDIGDVQLPTAQGLRNVAGYTINGVWDRPYSFADKNGDGIIVPSEITLAAADSFRGSTLPLYEAGLSNNIGLLGNRIHVSGLVDYRGKFWNTYTIGSNRCVSAANCEAINVKGSSLADQAAAVAAGSATLHNTRWGFYQQNDFIKLREISLTAEVPQSFASRYLKGRSAQVVLTGRNLATLWTKYPGIDPEANRNINGNDDLGTPPALRLWYARLNLAF
ncbi:MAG TPA: SusC/RagA family TonB-linked outer membrane protein [Gemmatimonadaceae bacterium]|nr:SusC/RagA family TonB-linked outer membrane protein [Gemmatimonadaceae bacterium]